MFIFFLLRELGILLTIASVFILGLVSVYQVDAKSQKIDAEVLDYHLKLAQGVLETCYTRDPDTNTLAPNPTLPILSDLAKTCDKKMKTLDTFLTKFVGDENGKIYADHVSNDSNLISSSK